MKSLLPSWLTAELLPAEGVVTRLLPEEVLDLLLADRLVGDVAHLPLIGWSARLLPVDLDLTLLEPDPLADPDLLLEPDLLPGAELLWLPCCELLDPLLMLRGPQCSGLPSSLLILTSAPPDLRV